jgi:anti-anti-sigma regulatory factor
MRLSNAEGLRREIAEAVPSDSAGLVVDLTEVADLDSSRLRLLFDMVRRVERRRQRRRPWCRAAHTYGSCSS